MLLALIALILVAAAGLWWYINNSTLRIAISKEQILQRMNDRLPVTETYLYIFKVTYGSPSIELNETSQRINAGLDVSVQITLLDNPEPLRGHLDAASGIRYDPIAGAFFLTDPEITNLQLDGLPDRWAANAANVVDQGLTSYFATHPIYTLTETQSNRAAKAVLQSLSIEGDRVVLQLGARK